MIRYVGCDYTRPRLDAFADGELAMGDQVLVESHLRWCHECAARLEDLHIIGASLRVSARALAGGAPSGGLHLGSNVSLGETDDPTTEGVNRALASMQAGVLARVDSEYEQSLAVRVQELFSDMRLWWPALGATAAVALCVGLTSGVWKATSSEQPESLAAMIESLADPGSNRNPQRLDAAMYLPRVLDDGAALDGARLAENAGGLHQDEVMAVAAVITREGKIGGYALLEQGPGHEMAAGSSKDDEVQAVLHAVRQSRFAPAQRPGGQVVAVNMVWLFARTTVKASYRAVDLGMPLTRPVIVVPPPVVKPAGLPAEGASSQERGQEPSVAPLALESATA